MTMETKHTPGPWFMYLGASPLPIVKSGFGKIASISRKMPKDEQKANARLIAAAPELLEVVKALIELRPLIEYVEPVKPEHEGEALAISSLLLKAITAIKKATP